MYCRIVFVFVILVIVIGTDVYGLRGGKFEGIGSVLGIETCKMVFLGGHFLFTCLEAFALGSIV